MTQLHYFSLLFLISILTLSTPTASSQSNLKLFQNEIQHSKNNFHCDSWRLSVETNNAGPWEAVPSKCVKFVAKYLNGHKYLWDSNIIASQALDFAKTIKIDSDGLDVWVFDIDETLLCNVPYYRKIGYGSKPFNEISFDAWVESAKAPALPASLRLYKELLDLGFKIVLLTGRGEEQRHITEKNLVFAGYHSWEKLLLRGPSDHGTTAVTFKSKKRAELVATGYRIHGCSGDQWSDLIGSPMATRVFKLPNPLYFIA